jgi:hypothetical protein
MIRFGPLLILVLLFLIAFRPEAYAYVDPASGSYFLQFLLAGLLGGLFALKLFWRRLKSGVGNLFRHKKKHNAEIGQSR